MPYVIIVIIGNDKNVYGPYDTFEKAQSVVGSYLFQETKIEKPDQTVDGITITQMHSVEP